MDNPLTNIHRYFVQFMLTNGTVSIEKALAFYKELDPGQGNHMLQLRTIISQINYKVSQQYFKIVTETCEVTNKKVIMWLNMKNDVVTQKQINFSPIELEYFHNVMHEIVMSDDYELLYPQCINISSHLSGPFTRENAEKLLLRWIREGYFVKNGVNVYLGPRTMHEFSVYLTNNVPDNCICGLCSALNLKGQVCQACEKKFHDTCITKYLQGQVSCPNCHQNWSPNT